MNLYVKLRCVTKHRAYYVEQPLVNGIVHAIREVRFHRGTLFKRIATRGDPVSKPVVFHLIDYLAQYNYTKPTDNETVLKNSGV